MDIIFKGRRTEVQERFRHHASAKLSKLEKLDHKAIRVDVEVSQERNPRQSGRRERIELTVRSRGPVIRAEAAADDRYVALDRALAKLEEQLRRTGSRRRKTARNGAAQTGRAGGWRPVAGVRSAMARASAGIWPNGASAPAADGEAPSTGVPAPRPLPQAEDAAGVVPIDMDGDGPLVVREKFHTAAPMSVDQALLEMELVGHDFYLFCDEQSGLPSVVYRRRGYNYGLIRLVEQIPAKAMVEQA